MCLKFLGISAFGENILYINTVFLLSYSLDCSGVYCPSMLDYRSAPTWPLLPSGSKGVWCQDLSRQGALQIVFMAVSQAERRRSYGTASGQWGKHGSVRSLRLCGTDL